VAGACECGNEPSGSIKCGGPVSFSEKTLFRVLSLVINQTYSNQPRLCNVFTYAY
jgi:hypothetical protein